MRSALFILLCLIMAGRSIDAQVIVTPSDTTACPDTEVFLHADYDHCLLTECYTGEEITFDWITDPGTAADLEDNDHDGPFPIGFEFCFFGETYDEFYVCDNGWISFTPPLNSWSNNSFPDNTIPNAAPSTPKNAIFAAWRDLFAAGESSSVQYFTTGIPGFRKTYIKFAEMEHPYCDDEIISYFEIVLHETENYIDNVFFQVELCDGVEELSILGIQNNAGTLGYAAPGKNLTEWDALSESFRWKPNDVRWIIDGDTVAYGPDISFFPAVSTDVIAMIIGCDGTIYTDTAHVHVPDYFNPVFEVTDNICYGENNGSINTTFPDGSTGYELNWSNGATTEDITNLEAGFYILTITDDNGCINEFSIYVDEPSQLIISPTGVVDETCPGANDGSITVSAFGGVTPYQFSLNGDAQTENNIFEDLSPGNYSVEVIDANGCVFLAEFVVGTGEEINSAITAISPVIEGFQTTITVTADGDIDLVEWEPDELLDPCEDPCSEVTATLGETTTFTATIYSATGCVLTETITVEVLPVDQLIFPNAFSPNADGTNDYFQTINEFLISEYQLEIFNRYGQVVFQTRNPGYSNGWDGTFESQPQMAGTYIWRATASFENGLDWSGSGNVILVR